MTRETREVTIMSDLLEFLWGQWNRIKAGATPLPTVANIPTDRCLPEGSAGYLIAAN
jgi:hypothetical protein